MDYFVTRRRPVQWFPHYMTWGWNRGHHPNQPVRYYTYSDEEDENAVSNNRAITISTEVNSDSQDKLEIVKVDMMVQQNARAHHTERFEQIDQGHLIIRRGQEFRILVSFNRDFQTDLDIIKFTFKTGQKPLPGNGTLVSFSTNNSTYGDWTADVQKLSDHCVEVAIATAADCIVGEWQMSIEAITKEHFSSKYSCKSSVYVLFNPWCKKDNVYFSDEDKLSEYILNDSGCIFSGNYRQIAATPWFFGQFEDGILDASIYCVVRAFNFRYGRAMADPVRVSRALSKLINSNDDRGVLVGNWSGEYDGGKAPWSWAGSVAILRQFIRTKTPVKFGQCFVFSGVLTTVCRALGLPCRSVTNYCSAHDTDASITIDQHWDLNGNSDASLHNLDIDSVWNFHCWNDVWMKRPDLPLGYDGWQVVDATPQETSDGVFQCGPASLAAILNGKCDFSYDAPFIFAEVNADIVQWGREPNGDWKIINVNKTGVGKLISTKVPDGMPAPKCLSDCASIRQDITEQYKYPDETEKERMAVVNASRSAITRRNVYTENSKEIRCHMVPPDNVLIGSDLSIYIIVSNTCSDIRNLKGQLSCYCVTYTGVRTKTIKTRQIKLTIGPGKQETIVLPVAAEEYIDHVTENAALKLCWTARIVETQQMIAMKDDFRLCLPSLQLKVLTERPRVGSVLKCRVYFKNPLRSRNLTNCSLDVEGPGLKEQKSFNIGVLQAGRDFTGILNLTPLKPGLRQIFVVFDCNQLQDIKGTDEVFVYATDSSTYLG